MKRFILFLVLWSAVASAQQDPAELLVSTADHLVIPANQTGSSITVITREQIEAGFYPFVIDVLRSVPGLFAVQGGSPGKAVSLFARGASSGSILVLIDGAQINNSIVAPDISSISTANVERIEIVRGPQSALYGSGAAGGVINIITRTAGPILSALAEGGSNETVRGSIRAGFGSDRNNVAVSYDGYNSNGEFTNDDYVDQTLDVNLRVNVTQWTNAGVHYRNNDSELGIPSSAAVPTPNRRQITETSMLHFPVRQQITSWWDIEGAYSYLKDEIEFRDPDSSAFSEAATRTDTYRITTTARPNDGHAILAGFEREELELNGLEVLDTTSFFGQYRAAFREVLNVAGGFRIDDHSFSENEFSPRISISYQATRGIRFFGSAGKGFRAPEPREISGPFGNPEIQPETVTGWDTGIEFHLQPKDIVFSGTFFWNEFHNLISFDFSSSRFLNSGDARASGIELWAHFRPLGIIRIDGSYTYLNTKDETLDLELLRRPEHSGSLQVGFRRRKISAHLRWIIAGERPDISDSNFQRIVNSGYSSADATITYQMTGDFRAYVRVSNIFNNSYEETAGFPAPDRGVFFGIAYR